MKLYVNHLGQWAGNQDEARSYGHAFDQVEVPYDKKGLLKFLNENKVIVSLPGNVPPPLTEPPSNLQELTVKELRSAVSNQGEKRYLYGTGGTTSWDSVREMCENCSLDEMRIAHTVINGRIHDILLKHGDEK
jgi:hypothetical protein